MNEKVQDYKIVNSIKEQKDSYDLWEICFGDTKVYMENYFEWRLKENQILALYDKEIMTSMIHLNPYPMIISGNEIHTNYIVGVATRPEYRKKGLMRNLLIRALQNMYYEGHGFTFLMPASDKIYLPFDFRYIYEQQRKKITVSLKELNFWQEDNEIDEIQAASIGKVRNNYKFTKENESNISIKVLDSVNSKELNQLVSFVNKKLNKTQEIHTRRDQYYYKRLQADMKSAGGNVLIVYNNGKIIGCISYMLEGDFAEVTEVIINKEFTKETISLVIKTMLEQWLEFNENSEDMENLEITLLESEFLDSLALNDMGFQEQIKPIIMARIVNLDNFMRFVTAKEPLSIIIKVEDPILEQNTGIWEFDFKYQEDNYLCKVSSTEKTPELNLDIATFTEIFMGYKKVKDIDSVALSKEVIEKLKKINFFHKIYLNEIV